MKQTLLSHHKHQQPSSSDADLISSALRSKAAGDALGANQCLGRGCCEFHVGPGKMGTSMGSERNAKSLPSLGLYPSPSPPRPQPECISSSELTLSPLEASLDVVSGLPHRTSMSVLAPSSWVLVFVAFSHWGEPQTRPTHSEHSDPRDFLWRGAPRRWPVVCEVSIGRMCSREISWVPQSSSSVVRASICLPTWAAGVGGLGLDWLWEREGAPTS
mmetsp:Transcript_45752/g.114678  ORF Transcript_45752/g.114678 Transcript_45752/m.114678 type:complete len:216 (+) Transcript_45752:142-789(+)